MQCDQGKDSHQNKTFGCEDFIRGVGSSMF